MPWTMDSHGNWTQSGGSGSSSSNSGGNSASSNSGKEVTDKGNTSDTNEAIKDSTSNKEKQIKYAEEANFSCDGDHTIRRGGTLVIGKGVAKRWQGEWKILQTTHKVDGRGYVTEGTLGRIPYIEEDNDSSPSSSNSSSTSNSDNSNSSGNSSSSNKSGNTGSKDNSSGNWYMDSHGVWHKK